MLSITIMTSNPTRTYSLIHAQVPDENGYDIDDLLLKTFDFVIKKDMYTIKDGYNIVYDFVRQLYYDQKKKLITPAILLSSDPSISSATISGVYEKFMYPTKIKEETKYKSDTKILYFDASPDLHTRRIRSNAHVMNSVISNCIGLTDESFTQHKLNIHPSDVYLIGINDDQLVDEDENNINKYSLNMFTLQLLRKKGLKRVLDVIFNKIQYDNIHVVIDMSCIDTKSAPSVFRNQDADGSGFNLEELEIICTFVKSLQKVNSIDITGYNLGAIESKDKNYGANYITVSTIGFILKNITALEIIKEKVINVFDENTKFVIWRPINYVYQEDNDEDDSEDKNDEIGWYILRNISNEERNKMIEYIGDDNIINVTVVKNGHLINALATTTSMAEQQQMTYDLCQNIADCCLDPEEKIDMMFEMLNTPKSSSTIKTDVIKLKI